MIPHGRHIYAKAFDVALVTMFKYPQSDHALPHCKYVLRCCADFPCLNLPNQEIDNQYSDKPPSIRFHIYRVISHCTAHCSIIFIQKKIGYMCKQESSSDEFRKI